MEPTPPTESILASFQALPVSTSVLVILFGWVLLSGLLLYYWLCYARHARRARYAAAVARNADAVRPLAAGDMVLSGKVLDEGEGPAVMVRIEQRGREWEHKGRMNHQWSENQREVRVRPFYVQRPSGERVRVEPDGRVFLVDMLDGMTDGDDEKTRWRTATLTPGESVHIVGILVRAPDPQSEGAPALVMRPPHVGRMLISTEPLVDRHARAARQCAQLALATLAALMLTHGVYLYDYHALQLTGRRVEAPITGTRIFHVWYKPRRGPGYYVPHYVIQARDPQTGVELEDESSQAFYRAATSREVQSAPFLVAGSICQIGAEPTQSKNKLVYLFFLTSVYAILCAGIRAEQRPWWDRKRVIDGGSGYLARATVTQR